MFRVYLIGVCGRYTLSRAEHLAEKLREGGYDFEEFSELRLVPRFNVAPTQRVPVICNDWHTSSSMEQSAGWVGALARRPPQSERADARG